MFDVLATLVILPFMLAYWLDPGPVAHAYLVNDDTVEGSRVLVLHERERPRAGGSICTLRIFDLDRGRQRGQLQWNASLTRDCDLASGVGRYAWLVFDGDGADWRAVDFFDGRVLGTIEDAAEDYRSKNPSVGQHRAPPGLPEDDLRSSLELEFQDGTEVSISPRGEVEQGQQSSDKVGTLVKLDVSGTPHQASDRHRATALSSRCGCATADCGELVSFASTTFGDTVWSLGLWQGSTFVWERSVAALGLDPSARPVALAEHDGRCLLVTDAPDGIVEFERDTADVAGNRLDFFALGCGFRLCR